MKERERKMQLLYEQWLWSGQRMAEFSKTHGYSPSTFAYWVKKFQTQTPIATDTPSGFSKLAFEMPDCSPQALTVITYPCGVKIELHTAVSAGYLRELAG